MKCIIRSASTVLRPGVIERVSDDEAFKAVTAGIARYVDKTAWKKQQRGLKKEV